MVLRRRPTKTPTVDVKKEVAEAVDAAMATQLEAIKSLIEANATPEKLVVAEIEEVTVKQTTVENSDDFFPSDMKDEEKFEFRIHIQGRYIKGWWIGNNRSMPTSGANSFKALLTKENEMYKVRIMDFGWWGTVKDDTQHGGTREGNIIGFDTEHSYVTAVEAAKSAHSGLLSRTKDNERREKRLQLINNG